MAAFISSLSSFQDTEKEDSSKISRSSSSKSKVAGYSKEFQAMLDSLEEEDSCEVEEDEEGCGTGSLLLQQGVEKKRRLNLGQVKALEKNFEVDNKLEPERKLKLAQELGLQPRQVAIWFQNRRARWKTKQLERDYSTLKSNYDSLKLDYNTLQQHNHSLSLKVKELKSKLGAAEDKAESSQSVKGEEEYHVSESDNTFSLQSTPNLDFSENNSTIKFQTTNNNSNSNSNDAALMNWIQFSDPRTKPQNEYHHHIVKLEEQPYYCSSLFSSGEESCTNLFSVDQAPSLPWYFSDQ